MRFLLGFAIWPLTLSVLVTGTEGQSVATPTEAELGAITERGRALAEYDAAVWHATDAVQTANPKTIEGQRCLAKKENARWTVVFGVLNGDQSKFLIAYEAAQRANPKEFAVKKDEPAREDAGFSLFAARALELALTDFGRVNRPYNAAVLPATQIGENGQEQQLYVYLYPAQTKAEIFPLGGDVRYLISADGTKILAKRQMHNAVIESPPLKGKKVVAGVHTHTLSDEPEDSDVLHALQQDPPVAELISTKHFLYEVAASGTIQIKKQKK